MMDLEHSLKLAVRAAVREELGSFHHGLMDREQVLEYLGITKGDLYSWISDGTLMEGVHWFFLKKNGVQTRKRKYVPDRCMNAILEKHSVPV